MLCFLHTNMAIMLPPTTNLQKMNKPPEFLALIEQVKASCTSALEQQADGHTRRLLHDQLLQLQQIEEDYKRELEEIKEIAGNSEFLLEQGLKSLKNKHRTSIEAIKAIYSQGIRNIQGFKQIV